MPANSGTLNTVSFKIPNRGFFIIACGNKIYRSLKRKKKIERRRMFVTTSITKSIKSFCIFYNYIESTSGSIKVTNFHYEISISSKDHSKIHLILIKIDIRIFILWHFVTEIVSIMRIFTSELLIPECGRMKLLRAII